MNKFFGAATLVAGLMAMSGTALANHEWNSSNRDWTPASTCSLTLNSVYQANSGQPIHVKVTNNTANRVRYTLDITLRRGRSDLFTGVISVDNANRNEQSDAGTRNAFSGDLSNTRVIVRVRTCEIVRS